MKFKVGAILLLALIVVALLPAGVAGPVEAGTASEEFAPGQVLVKWQPYVSAQQVSRLAARFGASQRQSLPQLGIERWQVPAGGEAALVDRLRQTPGVAYATLNYRRHETENYPIPAALVPNDPYYNQQWNLEIIDAAQAWDLTTGSPSVTVAVVDTGVDATHLDLAGRVVPGYDFVNNDPDPADDRGHGTMVAGVAAATGNNGWFVAGLAWQAQIMPVKVLDQYGSGYDDQISLGIRWAADHGAQIINLSLAGPYPSPLLEEAVDYAYAHGCLVVAAAGNDYQTGNRIMYPAALPKVIAVGGTTILDERAFYSSTGDYLDLAAPGGDGWANILSIWPGGGVGSGYGTSLASPHVAGLAALIWSRVPALSNAGVEQVLKAMAVDLGPAGWDAQFGSGRIDAQAAVRGVVFPDVLPGDWFYASVMRLYANGVVTGYPDGTFRSDNPINRAEIATMLVQAMGWPIDTSGPDFPDVPSTHWAYGFVKTARNHGVMSGYPDGTFKPDNPSTRAEAVVMLVCTLGLNPIYPAVPTFSDVPSTHWAYGYIEAAAANGLVAGYPDGTFRPEGQTTRAEASSLVEGILP